MAENVYVYSSVSSLEVLSGQVRSGQSAHSEQAVIVHACHGHLNRPSPVPLSRTGKKKRGMK